MSNTNISNNSVNETGVYTEGLSPGSCLVVKTRGSGVIKLLSEKSGRQKKIFVQRHATIKVSQV